MTAWSQPPSYSPTSYGPCAGTWSTANGTDYFTTTAETTNGFYGALSPAQGTSKTFTQEFGVVIPPSAASNLGGGGGQKGPAGCAQFGACAPAHVPAKLDAAVDPLEVQSASSYPSSCNNIGVVGSTLIATCRRNDGSFNHTLIAIQGIENNDGVLEFRGMERASTFQNSCKDIAVSEATLSATCQRTNGSFKPASIRIPGITSINGALRYQ
jgi:hypothetical protein